MSGQQHRSLAGEAESLWLLDRLDIAALVVTRAWRRDTGASGSALILMATLFSF